MMSGCRTFHIPPLLVLLVSVSGALAQEQSVPTKKQEATTPSLDDLLGIDGAEDAAGETSDDSEVVDPLEERRQEALDNRLNERSLAENLIAAVDDMNTAARMLGERRDPGLELQRLQLEIIRRLEAVIEEAQQQQQQQSQSSSSSSSEQQQQQQVPQQSQQQQQQEGNQQQQQSGNEGGDQQPPGRQEADLQAMFEESNVEWGDLPERMRDMIRQGMRESVSRMYRRMTEEYYRRIAEESSE